MHASVYFMIQQEGGHGGAAAWGAHAFDERRRFICVEMLTNLQL